MGLTLFVMFASYAYTFFMGSIWIEKGIYNSAFDRDYKAGDILGCFFGIVFGAFSIGIASQNIKAVGEGKVAGKMIFDIIDRKPEIE